MLPKTLTLIDDDLVYAEGLAGYLRNEGIVVSTFADGRDFLAHPDLYSSDFYVVDLMLPGIDGVELIKILRMRTNAGILVVSGRASPDTFKEVIRAGADMYLSKPVVFEQVALAVEAVQRRANAIDPIRNVWRLDGRIGQLIAPDGAVVELSELDRSVIECFVKANGGVVSRDTLLTQLGRTADFETSGGLNGTIFRLRRRIERATPGAVPLQTKSGVGYVFRAPLSMI